MHLQIDKIYVLFNTCLLFDGIFHFLVQITRMKWNCHFPCLRWMYVVPMRAFLIFKYPSICQN